MPEVRDCLVVGIEQDDGGYWMPLFVALADDVEAMMMTLVNPAQRDQFESMGDLDFAYAHGTKARFRCNYLRKLTGAGAVLFELGVDGCAGRTLAPGDSCSVAALMAPSSEGVGRAALAVTTAQGGGATVALSGTAVAPGAPRFVEEMAANKPTLAAALHEAEPKLPAASEKTIGNGDVLIAAITSCACSSSVSAGDTCRDRPQPLLS